MPLVTVKLFNWRLTQETEARVIAKLTDALCEAIGDESDEMRDDTWVLIEGYEPRRFGRGGRQWSEVAPEA